MTTRDVGDQVDLEHLVYNASGTLTAATVVLTLTDPTGTPTTPSVTSPSTGTYRASFALATAGLWSWVWTVSGAVVDVDQGSVLASNPAPATYATVPDLKAYLGITDTTEDALLLDALLTASRSVDHLCSRRFYPDLAATARVYVPRDYSTVVVDDFWTTTGLVIKTDSAGDGTYATTLTAADYVLEPYNGVNDGEPGWPYYRVRSAAGSLSSWNIFWPGWAPWSHRPPIQVTAKWGWATTPTPVRQATIFMAEENFKLKGSPFGVQNSTQYADTSWRTRSAPKVTDLLAPYRNGPVMVG